jgi:hypothetical protein
LVFRARCARSDHQAATPTKIPVCL